jgi:hypothetical protein
MQALRKIGVATYPCALKTCTSAMGDLPTKTPE